MPRRGRTKNPDRDFLANVQTEIVKLMARFFSIVVPFRQRIDQLFSILLYRIVFSYFPRFIVVVVATAALIYLDYVCVRWSCYYTFMELNYVGIDSLQLENVKYCYPKPITYIVYGRSETEHFKNIHMQYMDYNLQSTYTIICMMKWNSVIYRALQGYVSTLVRTQLAVAWAHVKMLPFINAASNRLALKYECDAYVYKVGPFCTTDINNMQYLCLSVYWTYAIRSDNGFGANPNRFEIP